MADFTTTFPNNENPGDGVSFDGGLLLSGPGGFKQVATTAGTCVSDLTGDFTGFILRTSSPGGTVGNNQYSWVIVGSRGANRWEGPCVRIQGEGANGGVCYQAEIDEGNNVIKVFKTSDNGTITQTQVGTNITATLADGDKVELRASGTITVTLTVLVNDVEVGQRTDSSNTIQNGQPGGYFYRAAGVDANFASWGGGDSVVATPVIDYGQDLVDIVSADETIAIAL